MELSSRGFMLFVLLIVCGTIYLFAGAQRPVTLVTESARDQGAAGGTNVVPTHAPLSTPDVQPAPPVFRRSNGLIPPPPAVYF